MDIDEIFVDIGELGRHQKKIFLAMALLHLNTAFHMLNLIFIGAKPKFSCLMQSGKVVVDSCDAECTAFEYSPEFTSIATEWDLVCHEAYKVSMVQSIFMLGVLLGAFVFGFASDRYGRLRTLYYGLLGLLILSFLSSFQYNFHFYVCLRLLAGFHCGGVILVSFVLLTELIGSSKRALCGMVLMLFFALGILIFSVLAYMIRDWRMLSAVTASGGIIVFLLTYCFVPESPRWLLIQGDIVGAEKVLEEIARKNGAKTTKIIVSKPTKSDGGKKYSITDLWKYSVLRTRTLIQLYAWFVNSAVYYGLTMSAGSLGNNMYQSVALSGMVEVPAYCVTIILLNRIGRKTLLCTYMIIGGITCIGVMIFPAAYTTTVTTLAMVGKLAIAASFAIIYLYSAELFPTVIRNVAMGLTSVAARLGGIVSPLIILTVDVHPSLPYLIYGLLAFTAGLLCFVLPETFRKPLPETIEDILQEDRQFPTSTRIKNGSDIAEDKVNLLQDKIEQRERGDVV